MVRGRRPTRALVYATQPTSGVSRLVCDSDRCAVRLRSCCVADGRARPPRRTRPPSTAVDRHDRRGDRPPRARSGVRHRRGRDARAKSPRDAQRQNAEAMTAVQQRLARAGRPARTPSAPLGYSIQQEFDFANGRRMPREYVARNGLEVRLDAVERTGEILDVGVQAGATTVSGVRFDFKDRPAPSAKRCASPSSTRGPAPTRWPPAPAGRVDRVLRSTTSRQPSMAPPRPMMTMRAAQARPTRRRHPSRAGQIEIRAQVDADRRRSSRASPTLAR